MLLCPKNQVQNKLVVRNSANRDRTSLVEVNHGQIVKICYQLSLRVYIPDVNECGTQLVLCDINADCENEFGTYSCRCKPGFQDESRLGSGGTVCVDVKSSGTHVLP